MTSRAVLALAGALLLSGCGFRPVYMSSANGAPGPAARNLAAIHVALIPDRPGQLLRQALQQHFQGADDATPRRYTLLVSYGISGRSEGIQPNSVATRVELIASASWVLTADDPAHTRITSGSALAMDGIDQFDQQYFAADLGNSAADRRLARAIAGQIALRLAGFFRNRADQAAR